MLARHQLFAFSLPLLGAVACATGGELPVEDERTPLLATEEDAGLEASTIRPSSNTPPAATPTADAATTPETSTPTPDAAVADTAPPPPPPPPPPPTTPVCASDRAALVFLLIAAGTPPPACNAGACNSGECCWNDTYCMP